MGIERQGSKSGVSGFFQLFDWNGKSKKKLLAKSDLQEGLKQGKKNVCNFPTTRICLSEEDENGGSSMRGSSDYSCASSETDDDDGYETKAPGVVAKLMGLDSLPTTSSSVEPYSTPFFDTRSLRDSRSYRRSEFHNECQIEYPAKQSTVSEEFSRNSVESRFHKLNNRSIERFRTEILPPKLAKSVPITHHKLSSPIKNCGFISSKDAAHIMEAAAKIIEPEPQSSTKGKMSSERHSTVPLRVRDFKEKLEAAERPSRLDGQSRRRVESNAAKYLKGQSMSKSWNGPEDPPRYKTSNLEESDSIGSRNKGKSVPPAVQAKTNGQRKESSSYSGGSKSLTSHKEYQDINSNQIQMSRSNTQRSMQKKSSTQNASGVLRQNNQKQNCVNSREKSLSKPSSNLQGRKPTLGDASFARNKTLTKVAGKPKAGPKKIGTEMAETKKEVQSLETRNVLRKKRSIEVTRQYEKGDLGENISGVKSDRSLKNNMADTRKKGMDVVSFTFTSPMVKSRPGSQSSSPVVDKTKCYSVDCREEKNIACTPNTKLSSLGLNVIRGDNLGVLLERKLKELTYGVESTGNTKISTSASILQDLVSYLNSGGTTSWECNKRSHLRTHTYKSGNLDGSNGSSTYTGALEMNHKLQGVEEMHSNDSNNGEARKEIECQHLSPMSILDPSFSIDSSNSSDTGDINSSIGSKQNPFVQVEQILASRMSVTETETDLSDSASSTLVLTSSDKQVTSLTIQKPSRSNQQEELEYVREIICNAELVFNDFALGQTPEIIDRTLFDQLENSVSSKYVVEENGYSRQRRKMLFDCTIERLGLRSKRLVDGGCRRWAKGETMFMNKRRLSEEIYKEITEWGRMGDFIVDELVDKDMSTQHGKWVDFEIEEFEEGVEIEKWILNSLIDEVVCLLG